jgi:hypothetical protein
MDTKFGLPKPCDVGTYSTGGSLEAPNAACVACPDGFTTQKDEVVGVEDCDGEQSLAGSQQWPGTSVHLVPLWVETRRALSRV